MQLWSDVKKKKKTEKKRKEKEDNLHIKTKGFIG